MTFKTKSHSCGPRASCSGSVHAKAQLQDLEPGSRIAFLDEGGFGNPTMNNMLAQMCTGQAKGHIIPDAVVALDPKSAPVRHATGLGRRDVFGSPERQVRTG